MAVITSIIKGKATFTSFLMASSFHFIALCSLLFISVSFAKTSLFKPKALLLPVTKDPSTLQYLTHIKQRTPFVEAVSNFTRVAPVTPFEVCYSSKNIGSTHVGPAVPAIDFVLQSEEVYWRVFGANSMVQVSKDVMCLGFLKLRLRFPWHAITIGGYQLENNLLQFNVAKSSLGFSSSLLLRQTACANFNFTSATQLSSVFLV